MKESRGTGTSLCGMLALLVLPVPLVHSVMPARGPRGPSGEVLGKVGGDERPAGAAASLSSCQMSLKGWKNRLGRAWKGQAPGGTSAIPGEIQKMHTLGKPWAPLPPPHPTPPPALMLWVGGPGKWGGTGSWHGCGDSGTVLSKSLGPFAPLFWHWGSHCCDSSTLGRCIFEAGDREASPGPAGNTAACPRL